MPPALSRMVKIDQSQKKIEPLWPLSPPRCAFVSEGGHDGRYPRGGTTMKSSIRTFVLAAIAAASFAATTHSASAQKLYANITPLDHVLPFESIATINAIIVPAAGTYVL